MSDNGNSEFHIETLEYELVAQGLYQKVSYGPIVTMAFCAVTFVPFAVELLVEYYPDKRLIEFESFDEWLGKELPTEPHTIESMGLRIFSALLEALGDIPLCVVIDAKTTVHGPASTEVYNDRWNKVQYS